MAALMQSFVALLGVEFKSKVPSGDATGGKGCSGVIGWGLTQSCATRQIRTTRGAVVIDDSARIFKGRLTQT